MKRAGYTLIEMVMVVSVISVMFLLVPKLTQQQLHYYQEQLFFSEFENLFKMSQTSAIATGQASYIDFLKPPSNTIKFTIHGEPEMNQTLTLPDSLQLAETDVRVIKSQSGTVGKFEPIIFYNQTEQITYVFQMGGGRFYVERTPL